MIEIVRLSVLDQSPVSEGSTGSQALRNTIDLARHTESLGYHRYWVAEHHGGPSLAGPSPEVLIGPIASATSRIRVGSGGVMLPHYSPLKVAESFSLLAGLFPGRIDLGIGRAAGTDPMTTFALQRDRRQAAPDDFPEQLAELLAYYDDSFPEGHALGRLVAHAARPPRAAGPVAARLLAAERDLGRRARAALRLRRLHQPGRRRDRAALPRPLPALRAAAAPRTAVAVWAVAADDAAEAQRLASSSRMTLSLLRQGRLIPVPPPDKALRFLETQGAQGAAPAGRRAVVGDPASVRAGLEQVADEYAAEEVIVVTITFDHEARRRSYSLIADAFALPGARRPRAAA